MLYWVIVGLLAGAIAKAVVPGTKREPQGCLFTMLLGIAGSVTTGFVMGLLGYKGDGHLVPTIVGATIGAIVLIFLCRKLWK